MAAEVINGQASALGISVWVPQERVFSGTFVNPNNYATYAAVLALTALVLAFRLPGRNTEREATRERWRRRISAVSGLRGVWFALALILCAGVLLSGSRAGMGSLILGLVAMAMFYTRGMARVLFAVLIPLVVTALMVFAPAGERLTEKSVSLVHEGAGSRELLAKMTLDAIEARPWVGWGMNSFEDLYNVLQPPSLTEFFDKSHNTYLELAFDLGIPVASALVLAVGLVAGRCAVGCVVRKRDRELPMLGLLTTMMVAFHALFDFSLQIPAMTCTYMAILGVAWANSWSRHTRVAE
jgi:O-antigen ligase